MAFAARGACPVTRVRTKANWDVSSYRSIAHRAKGQHDRAIQDYDQAIKLNPIHTYAFNYTFLVPPAAVQP